MIDLLAIAIKYYGVFEVDGSKSNPLILSWIKKLFPWADDDSTIAWCSVFMHQIIDESQYTVSKGKDAGLARSWLKYGVSIPSHLAMPGDIVVFWRGSADSWSGHVGLFINQDENIIRVLGGNQSNGVNIRNYDKKRLLGIRRLRADDRPKIPMPLSIKLSWFQRLWNRLKK